MLPSSPKHLSYGRVFPSSFASLFCVISASISSVRSTVGALTSSARAVGSETGSGSGGGRRLIWRGFDADARPTPETVRRIMSSSSSRDGIGMDDRVAVVLGGGSVRGGAPGGESLVGIGLGGVVGVVAMVARCVEVCLSLFA